MLRESRVLLQFVGDSRKMDAMSKQNASELSDVDRRIVVALQADGRATWAKVAAASGVSESTAARRGVRLLREGVVTVPRYPIRFARSRPTGARLAIHSLRR